MREAKMRLYENIYGELEEDDRCHLFGNYGYRYNLSDGRLELYGISKKTGTVYRFDLPEYEVYFGNIQQATKERKVRATMVQIIRDNEGEN